MAGAYIGSLHGGNEFTGESASSVRAKAAKAAARNIRAASDGGRKAVVSSDGQRLLLDPRRADAPRPDPRDYRNRTAGPGVAGVGRAPSAGPGGAVTATGAPLTSGPGLGVITTGTAFYQSWLPADYSWGITDTKRTPMMIGGEYVHIDPRWSDAGDAEQRWGEGELLSPTWFYQWGVAGADMINHGSISLDANTPKDADGKSKADRMRETFGNARDSGWATLPSDPFRPGRSARPNVSGMGGGGF